MQLFETIVDYFKDFNMYRGTINLYDILEILIIAFLVYYILVWMKTTRAWQLLKGLIVIGVFLALAYFLDMTTIIWMARNLLSFAVIAIIIVLQPELRHALEELGRKNFIPTTIFADSSKREKEILTQKIIADITSACFEMGKVKTGALIVIEQEESLKEYEKTGISIDGLISSQLLINIFEHNTPLHDGAVIIRDNRIAAATCYLHLSSNLNLSKELGTRHRAAVGVSEETDSLTIVVSEQTGMVSVAYEGELTRDVTPEYLRDILQNTLNKKTEEESNHWNIWRRRGKQKDEKKTNE